MKCPKCPGTKDRVMDTRRNVAQDRTRRIRMCLKCKRRYSTIEMSREDFEKAADDKRLLESIKEMVAE